MPQLDRITQDPAVIGGKPCIRGMRVTVGMVVGQIGAGHTIAQVLADYPYLEREDVLQALRYAACEPKSGKSLCLVHETDLTRLGTCGAWPATQTPFPGPNSRASLFLLPTYAHSHAILIITRYEMT